MTVWQQRPIDAFYKIISAFRRFDCLIDCQILGFRIFQLKVDKQEPALPWVFILPSFNLREDIFYFNELLDQVLEFAPLKFGENLIPLVLSTKSRIKGFGIEVLSTK